MRFCIAAIPYYAPMTAQFDQLLFRQTRSLRAGQVDRFSIRYTPKERAGKPPNSLWLKIKNTELVAMRAAYIGGPYVLYVDCKPSDYDLERPCFITADQPVFEPQLLPGQSFYAELSCHTIKDSYCWVTDIVSQVLFNSSSTVDFELTIGTSKKVLHDASVAVDAAKVPHSDQFGTFAPPEVLTVSHQDTLDLWNLPLPDPSRPIHLVVLTHGLHSNVGADMLYIKERIDRDAGSRENIVVKGFFGNICKTERGIKYLGSRVAEYVVDLVTKNETFNNGKVAKISFVGHSLGGLVQTFAIAYLQSNFPSFFDDIKPINFVTLALPLLGVANENPVYVKLALLAGIVGKTGQDLGLKYLENNSKPLLLLLPAGPSHQALKKFARRTVYANVINDGLVPLRTLALLYLDYKGLSTVLSSESETESKTAAKATEESNNPEEAAKNTQKIPQNTEKEDSALLPSVQAMLTYFMPQKQTKKPENSFSRFQTVDELLENVHDIQDENPLGELPKASVLEIATTLILPPLPSMKYITNPSSRLNVIVHDKMYYDYDLPAKEDTSTPPLVAQPSATTPIAVPDATGRTLGLRQRLLNGLDYTTETANTEEQIAREYHKNMSWRKVLVRLKPDAHNNIFVRRRFANAYGWPVVDHLIKNHFGDEPVAPEAASEDSSVPLSSTDSLDQQLDLSTILSRDLISRQNADIERESLPEPHDHSWINSKDNAESMFAVGPAGLLSDVTEMVHNLKDQWYNLNNVADSLRYHIGQTVSGRLANQIGDESGDLALDKSVMGGFI